MSALQTQRVMGFGSYRTAHYMCHRVRAGLPDEELQKLIGIVEVDETLIGGKSQNRHRKDRRGKSGNFAGDKEIVAGAVDRNGSVVPRVVANTTYATLKGFTSEAVSSKVSMICTDQYPAYQKLTGDCYLHRMVDHHQGQYVVGPVHTQTIEGFGSLVKRFMVGTSHKVSAKYLPLYVVEFQFRYNNWNNDDNFGAAISVC